MSPSQPPQGSGQRLLLSSPRHILLVRLSARGDLVFASPLVRALRRTYPHARLTWIAESHTVDLIRHHPELDEVLVWDRGGWKKLLKRGRILTLVREACSFVRSLRARRFDVALDLQGLLRSGLVTYLSGAPLRVGLGSKEGSRIFMTHVLPRDAGNTELISSEYRFLAEELGLDVGDFELEVPLSVQDRAWADARIRELGLEKGFLAAIPFTTRPQKHWFEDRWGELLDRALPDLGLPPLVLGGPGDLGALERLRLHCRIVPLDLVGKTSLSQAAAVVERATLVVGVDTGLTHVAVASKRPTIALFGSNIPYTEPLAPQAKVLVHWLPCSPCKGNPTCGGEFTCMRLITVDEILAAAREVLGARGRPVAAIPEPRRDPPEEAF